MKYDNPIYLGATVFGLSALQMYEVFYNIKKQTAKDLQFHCMKTDSFILNFSESTVAFELMDLINLDIPKKTNNEVLRKFKSDIFNKISKEFVLLISNIFSLAC